MNSFRKVNVDIVIPACRQFLEHIDSIIKQRQEDAIEEEMKKIKKYLWFFCKPNVEPLFEEMKRQKVIEELKSDCWSEYVMAKFYRREDYNKIKKLLALAEMNVSSESIMLSDEHAYILKDYMV